MYEKYIEFIDGLKQRYGKAPKMDFEEFKKFARYTHPQKLWWHLQEFGFITNRDCHEFYGIRHCPGVIRDLKNNLKIYGAGDKQILSVEKSGVDRWGNKTPFVEYTLCAA